MTLDIDAELDKTFAEALKQHAATKLRTGEDWAKYREIEERHDQLRAAEREDFQASFEERMAVARQKAIAEAGELNLEHPTPLGTDQFDKDRIERRAAVIVEHGHQRAMSDIDVAEAEEHYHLTEEVRERDQPDLARDFERTAEPSLSMTFQRS